MGPLAVLSAPRATVCRLTLCLRPLPRPRGCALARLRGPVVPGGFACSRRTGLHTPQAPPNLEAPPRLALHLRHAPRRPHAQARFWTSSAPHVPRRPCPPASAGFGGRYFRHLEMDMLITLVQFARANYGPRVNLRWVAHCNAARSRGKPFSPARQSTTVLSDFLNALWPGGTPSLAGPDIAGWTWERQCHQFMLAHVVLWATSEDASVAALWDEFDALLPDVVTKHPCFVDTGLLRRFLRCLPPDTISQCPLLGATAWPAHRIVPLDGVVDPDVPLPPLDLPHLLVRLGSVPPPGAPPLSNNTVVELQADEERRMPARSRAGNSIYQVYVNHLRSIDPRYEAAWALYVERLPTPAQGSPLDPRMRRVGELSAFLLSTYGTHIPQDGVPESLTWDGRRAALGHLVSWLLRFPQYRDAWQTFSRCGSSPHQQGREAR